MVSHARAGPAGSSAVANAVLLLPRGKPIGIHVRMQLPAKRRAARGVVRAAIFKRRTRTTSRHGGGGDGAAAAGARPRG